MLHSRRWPELTHASTLKSSSTIITDVNVIDCKPGYHISHMCLSTMYLILYVFIYIMCNTQRTRMLGYVRIHMPKRRMLVLPYAPKDCESRVNWQRLEALQVQLVVHWGYPLVMTNSLLWKMAIEIVSFPTKEMVIFHSYVKLPEGNLRQ